MTLPLAEGLTLGVQTIHRRTEPSTERWTPSWEDGRDVVELVDRLGFDSIWVGDHLAFSIPLLDPVVQLSQAAVFSSRLKIGTAVFLQPLRHPGPTAKQIATLGIYFPMVGSYSVWVWVESLKVISLLPAYP